MRYVVPDTCALAAALYNESLSLLALPLLEAIRRQDVDAVAPSSEITEFFNLSRRKGDPRWANPPLSAVAIDAVVSDFLALPIVWVEVEPLAAAAWRIHQNYGIESGDAFFAAVASEWQAEIWTTDTQFAASVQPVHLQTFDLKAVPFR